MENIKSQLDDLYQLQMAAKRLKHGIDFNSKGWKLFEPSRFIYAFFAFNNFYSINWKESYIRQELIFWEIKNEKSGLNESDKILELVKYLKDEQEKYCEKQQNQESFALYFIKTLKLRLKTDPEQIIESLDRIIKDDNINGGRKKEFIKAMERMLLPNKEIKDFEQDFFKVLRFILNVRNNIFHGTKTVFEMTGDRQRERLKIYTDILLTTNEVLFETVEKNFGWSRSHIDMDFERKMQRTLQNQALPQFRTVVPNFKLDITKGVLFYPCCGDDTYQPIIYFLDIVSEFHFADSRIIPNLPKLECEPNRNIIRKENYHDRRIDEPCIIPRSIIENVIEIEHAVELINRDKISVFEKADIRFSDLKNERNWLYKEKWIHNSGREIPINLHIQDGLATFITLPPVSVFFLRGDSEGEGGSGQRWLGERVFKVVLDKLVDGGLIVSDGSGWDPDEYKTAPWKIMWEKKNNEEPSTFFCLGREFDYIGSLAGVGKKTHIWKVTRKNNALY